ncbi:hypothetical protein BURPS1710b_0497 [Burkholderia pseudomallei 1710b]|uniref:Uncharacterized protein n=1 Tax=Burkholderia pseudomallei (strain 1710b) TaxID=320372 RepID=Q3JWZ2_BURP1|nr:hypothetical protein BURPS1710b_0497 [Burkholderia pseudomallei 1710b]
MTVRARRAARNSKTCYRPVIGVSIRRRYGIRLRSLCHRRGLGRRAPEPRRGVLRRARRHRRGRAHRRHLRAARLHPEKAARLRVALQPRCRGRRGLWLDLRHRPVFVADAHRGEGPRDRAPERYLRRSAEQVGRRDPYGARDARRRAYGRRRGPACHRPAHRRRDRLAAGAAADSRHRARDHVARGARVARAAAADRDRRRRLHRGRVRGHLQRARRRCRPVLSRRADPARLRRRRAARVAWRDDEAGCRHPYARDDRGDRARRRRRVDAQARRGRVRAVRRGAVCDGARREWRRARARGGRGRARRERRDRSRRLFGDDGAVDPRDRRRHRAPATDARRDARRHAARGEPVRRQADRRRSSLRSFRGVQPAGDRDGRAHRGASARRARRARHLQDVVPRAAAHVVRPRRKDVHEARRRARQPARRRRAHGRARRGGDHPGHRDRDPGGRDEGAVRRDGRHPSNRGRGVRHVAAEGAGRRMTPDWRGARRLV